jgi:antitoxin component of MazEF toxin-antitoxin module
MTELTIVPLGESAAVVLPAELLEAMGLRVGDVVEATLADRELILRPGADAGRRQVIEEITREMFERRADAYRRLA